MPSRNIAPISKTIRDVYLPLSAMQERVSDLFNDFFSDISDLQSLNAFGPLNRIIPVSVRESGKEVVIKAELPAVSDKDISVNIRNNRVIISGEKKTEAQEDKDTYHISEIAYGRFSRSITLPFDIDASKVRAEFKNGLLTVHVEKPAREKDTMQTVPVNAQK